MYDSEEFAESLEKVGAWVGEVVLEDWGGDLGPGDSGGDLTAGEVDGREAFSLDASNLAIKVSSKKSKKLLLMSRWKY